MLPKLKEIPSGDISCTFYRDFLSVTIAVDKEWYVFKADTAASVLRAIIDCAKDIMLDGGADNLLDASITVIDSTWLYTESDITIDGPPIYYKFFLCQGERILSSGVWLTDWLDSEFPNNILVEYTSPYTTNDIDAEYSHTVSQTEYVNFYSDLVSRIKKQISKEYMTPSPRSIFQISTGISGVHFEWAFHGRPRSSFGVELHFEKGNKASNLRMIERIEQLKDVIEKDLAEKVTFQKDWGKAWSRLFIEKQEGKITEELKVWAVEMMVKLINRLQPELDNMKNG